MTLIEAAKLAREAFEWNFNTDLDNIPACERWAKMLKENINALDQAIAEAEQQEPVKFKCVVIDDDNPNGVPLNQWGKPRTTPDHTEQHLEMVKQREWQGLTDEEMHECWDSPLTPLGMKHARMIEAKLKEKNHANGNT